MKGIIIFVFILLSYCKCGSFTKSEKYQVFPVFLSNQLYAPREEHHIALDFVVVLVFSLVLIFSLMWSRRPTEVYEGVNFCYFVKKFSQNYPVHR